MKISAIQLLEQANKANGRNFNNAMAHLNFLMQAHAAGLHKTNDSDLQRAYQGIVDRANQFLQTNPKWVEAEIEIYDQSNRPS